MTIALLVFFLFDLLSVGFIIAEIVLWREWYENRYTDDAYAERCIYAAVALLIIMIAGKFITRFFLGKKSRRPIHEEPEKYESRKTDSLLRPDGTKIHLEYYGDESAQPLIFIHGWNSSLQSFYYQRKFFAKKYRVILMDLRGLGKSTRPRNNDYSIKTMAEDLNAVILHTRAKNPILWGHSMGGMTILTMLTQTNTALVHSVRGIILQHTTYTKPNRTCVWSNFALALEKPLMVPICWYMIALWPVVWVNKWLSYLNGNAHISARLLSFGGSQTPGQVDFSALLNTETHPAVSGRGALAMREYDVTKKLPSLHVPALIFASNNDKLTKPSASDFMKTLIPNSKEITLAPAGHLGLMEKYDDVNHAAEEFILSLKKPVATASIEELIS